MRTLNQLHIATLPNGKHLLVGSLDDAQTFMSAPAYKTATLDSESLAGDHAISVSWLVENDIKKVINL